MYLNNSYVYGSGFVRTIAMRFEQGTTDLKLLREARVNAFNLEQIGKEDAKNATDIYGIGMPGDPILDQFEMTEAKIEAAKEAARRSNTEYVEKKEFSTIVYIEVQVYTAPSLLK